MPVFSPRLVTLGCALAAVLGLARPSASSAQFGTLAASEEEQSMLDAELRSFFATRFTQASQGSLRPVLSAQQRQSLSQRLQTAGGSSLGPQGAEQPLAGNSPRPITVSRIGTLAVAPPPPPISRFRP